MKGTREQALSEQGRLFVGEKQDPVEGVCVSSGERAEKIVLDFWWSITADLVLKDIFRPYGVVRLFRTGEAMKGFVAYRCLKTGKTGEFIAYSSTPR